MDLKEYTKPEYYRNRELSWIGFNERVLSCLLYTSDSITGVFKKNWKLVLGAICILVVIVAASVVMKNKKYTINLEDFYEVEFSGANKYGYAAGDFDDNAIMDYILETSDRDDDTSEFSNYMIVDWIISNVDTKMSKSENLKNEDKIKITFEYPKGAKVKGYRIKGKSLTVEVNGLENYREKMCIRDRL